MADVLLGPGPSTFHLNAIRDVDRSVEFVLDALEASGQADRTVVVFTSDRGETPPAGTPGRAYGGLRVLVRCRRYG
ncbi:sulfatase-like hydrolase/transferase [Streptomyces sp. NRRL F-2747]|uniref:sulfatase-like hydrolase/transferase n=1 Tax=Streptomyces sp. NRRL F-2747 TaxID=1463843 RepID=UPI0004C483C5|nr:sulfatase-like hydrolase/transferase [Streptomyces sp. NRRL F-2747]